MSNWGLSNSGATSTPAIGVTAVNQPSTADTYGAWVELTASAPAGVVGLRLSRSSVGNNLAVLVLQIGIGASGSEIPLVDGFGSSTDDNTRDAGAIFDFPVCVPAGARLAMRARGNQTFSTGHSWEVSFFTATGMTPVGCSRIVGYGLAAGPTGTTVTPALNDWGTAVEFVASTPHRVRSIGIQMLRGATTGTVRGFARVCNAAGTIQYGPIKPISGSGTASLAYRPDMTPCDIPAGTALYVQTEELANASLIGRPFLLLLGF